MGSNPVDNQHQNEGIDNITESPNESSLPQNEEPLISETMTTTEEMLQQTAQSSTSEAIQHTYINSSVTPTPSDSTTNVSSPSDNTLESIQTGTESNTNVDGITDDSNAISNITHSDDTTSITEEDAYSTSNSAQIDNTAATTVATKDSNPDDLSSTLETDVQSVAIATDNIESKNEENDIIAPSGILLLYNCCTELSYTQYIKGVMNIRV